MAHHELSLRSERLRCASRTRRAARAQSRASQAAGAAASCGGEIRRSEDGTLVVHAAVPSSTARSSSTQPPELGTHLCTPSGQQ
eukprot:scaffold56895_cov30-Phaeocystis_antarctica.AAC.1